MGDMFSMCCCSPLGPYELIAVNNTPTGLAGGLRPIVGMAAIGTGIGTDSLREINRKYIILTDIPEPLASAELYVSVRTSASHYYVIVNTDVEDVQKLYKIGPGGSIINTATFDISVPESDEWYEYNRAADCIAGCAQIGTHYNGMFGARLATVDVSGAIQVFSSSNSYPRVWDGETSPALPSNSLPYSTIFGQTNYPTGIPIAFLCSDRVSKAVLAITKGAGNTRSLHVTTMAAGTVECPSPGTVIAGPINGAPGNALYQGQQIMCWNANRQGDAYAVVHVWELAVNSTAGTVNTINVSGFNVYNPHFFCSLQGRLDIVDAVKAWYSAQYSGNVAPPNPPYPPASAYPTEVTDRVYPALRSDTTTNTPYVWYEGDVSWVYAFEDNTNCDVIIAINEYTAGFRNHADGGGIFTVGNMVLRNRLRLEWWKGGSLIRYAWTAHSPVGSSELSRLADPICSRGEFIFAVMEWWDSSPGSVALHANGLKYYVANRSWVTVTNTLSKTLYDFGPALDSVDIDWNRPELADATLDVPGALPAPSP